MKKTILMMTVAATGLLAFVAPSAKETVKSNAVAGGSSLAVNAETYKVDAAKSTFKWIGKKVSGEHYGIVKFSEGTVSVEKNVVTGGSFTVDMNSIEVQDLTGEWKDKLTGHLRSDDFFSVDKHAKSTLVIKSLTAIKDAKPGANNYDVKADLTIKGISSEITFPAMVLVKKGEVVVNAEFGIDRTKYDIKYGSGKFFQGLGDKMIDDNFQVKVRVVAVK